MRVPAGVPRGQHGRRRLSVLAAHVTSGGSAVHTLHIGDARLAVPAALRPESVPALYGPTDDVPEELSRHLLWLLRKFQVGQDVFLIGPPGPIRRRLALWCCELLGREVEYVALSRDTTENDLKQRREIVGGGLVWKDQAPVRAALAGRVLILDGIEKAERNVLPTLNNLLENREMQLQDGRFLASPQRLEEEVTGNLVQVSSHFRVIALGVPVPAFAGYMLDPPLRSRFQARYVGNLAPSEQLRVLRRDFPRLSRSTADVLVGCAMAIQELWASASQGKNPFKVLACPEDLPRQVAVLLEAFPALESDLFPLVHRAYPAGLLAMDPSTHKAVQHALEAQGLAGTLDSLSEGAPSAVPLQGVLDGSAVFHSASAPVRVPMGTGAVQGLARTVNLVVPESWAGLLSGVVQDLTPAR